MTGAAEVDRLGSYFERPPERLVLEGYRRSLAGLDHGSVDAWSSARTIYRSALGSSEGARALRALAEFVKAMQRCANCPLRFFPFDAHYVCRDECLALGLVAAIQHDDRDAAGVCLRAMTCPARSDELACAAVHFARILTRSSHILLPIPQDAIEDVLGRASTPAAYPNRLSPTLH